MLWSLLSRASSVGSGSAPRGKKSVSTQRSVPSLTFSISDCSDNGLVVAKSCERSPRGSHPLAAVPQQRGGVAGNQFMMGLLVLKPNLRHEECGSLLETPLLGSQWSKYFLCLRARSLRGAVCCWLRDFVQLLGGRDSCLCWRQAAAGTTSSSCPGMMLKLGQSLRSEVFGLESK